MLVAHGEPHDGCVGIITKNQDGDPSSGVAGSQVSAEGGNPNAMRPGTRVSRSGDLGETGTRDRSWPGLPDIFAEEEECYL